MAQRRTARQNAGGILKGKGEKYKDYERSDKPKPSSSRRGGDGVASAQVEALDFVYGLDDDEYVEPFQGFELVYATMEKESDAPKSFVEALRRSDGEKWRKPAEEEVEALLKNGTWEYVKLPPGRKAIGSKWVFKIKRNADGSIDRYKGRLVAKGYSQRPGIDFNEVFSPTVQWNAL